METSNYKFNRRKNNIFVCVSREKKKTKRLFIDVFICSVAYKLQRQYRFYGTN